MKHTEEIKSLVEVDRWVAEDVTGDERKVIHRLPDSVALLLYFLIKLKSIANCHRSVLEPSKTSVVMVVLRRWSRRDRVSLKTKFGFKSDLINLCFTCGTDSFHHYRNKGAFLPFRRLFRTCYKRHNKGPWAKFQLVSSDTTPRWIFGFGRMNKHHRKSSSDRGSWQNKNKTNQFPLQM